MEYEIVFFEVFRRRLAGLLRQETEPSRRQAIHSALRAVYQWLRSDPLTFGEIRYHTPGTQRPVRLGVVAPVAARFAVYEAERKVWLLEVTLLSP